MIYEAISVIAIAVCFSLCAVVVAFVTINVRVLLLWSSLVSCFMIMLLKYYRLMIYVLWWFYLRNISVICIVVIKDDQQLNVFHHYYYWYISTAVDVVAVTDINTDAIIIAFIIIISPVTLPIAIIPTKRKLHPIKLLTTKC